VGLIPVTSYRIESLQPWPVHHPIVFLIPDFLIILCEASVAQISECLSHAVDQVVALALRKDATLVNQPVSPILVWGIQKSLAQYWLYDRARATLSPFTGQSWTAKFCLPYRFRSSCAALIPLALASMRSLSTLKRRQVCMIHSSNPQCCWVRCAQS